jgi:hypothetical protein
MKINIYIIATITLVGFIGGCGASMKKMQERPITEGKEKLFNATIGETLMAVELACGQLLFDDIRFEESISPNTKMIIAKKSMNLASNGSFIRILIIRKSDNETIVRIVTKRIKPLDIFAKDDYSKEIFNNIQTLLQIHQSNKQMYTDTIIK